MPTKKISCIVKEKSYETACTVKIAQRMTERHGTFMAKERANIYTIAKEAGVSPATVSLVLTNKYRVSEEKLENVQSVIHKYV